MPGRHEATQPGGLPKIDLPPQGGTAAISITGRLRAVALNKGTPPPVNPLAHAGDRVLLLQGPYGPFFKHLAGHLSRLGATVRKINFNGGDRYFYSGPEAEDYTGDSDSFPNFLREYLLTHRISRVFLFADCRPHHLQAIRVCRERGIPVRVFEYGYLRPDYITCELDGVNGYSSLPRDPAFYLSQPDTPAPRRQETGTSYVRMAFYVMAYFLVMLRDKANFPHYHYHKDLNVLWHARIWWLSVGRKVAYSVRDKLLTRRLAGEWSGRYYLVPLQVYDDSQIQFHSRYRDVTDFIREVVASFARHAPAGTLLVLKHHPMDRGYRHYGKLIDGLAGQYGLAGRLVYTHDIHLPTSLDHTLGVVTVNSTVGLSAIWHKAPVKVMGKAVYDIAGLTCQKPLDEFWQNPPKPSPELNERFRNYLLWHCQLNESFYGTRPFRNSAPRTQPGTRH